MKSIGITTYSMEFERNDKKILLNELNNQPFYDFFLEYLNSVSTNYTNDEKNQKVLSISEYETFEITDKDGTILYDCITGEIKSGEYGLESEIVNPSNGNVVYEKPSSYADVMPFSFTIGIARNDVDKAIVILQSISNYGIKSAFLQSIKNYIGDNINYPIRVTLGTLMPQEYLKIIMEYGEFNKIRLIKYGIPTDISDKFGDNSGVKDRDNGYMETVLVRGRGGISRTIRKFSELILEGFRDNSSIIKIQEVTDIPCDSVKIEVKLGNRTKTLSMKNLSNLNITEDITDDVTTGEGGHPLSTSIYPILKDRLHEYFELLGILG